MRDFVDLIGGMSWAERCFILVGGFCIASAGFVVALGITWLLEHVRIA